MASPISILTRAVRPPRVAPAVGRCPVCHEAILDPTEMLTLRGGIPVHRACATYRIRQRARGL